MRIVLNLLASLILVAALFVAAGGSGHAEDAWFLVPWERLHLADGPLPNLTAPHWRLAQYAVSMRPYAALDGPGDVYVTTDPTALVARAPAGGDVSGTLFWPKPDWSGMVPRRFTVAAAAASDDARTNFFREQRRLWSELIRRGLPGGAWFRHRQDQAWRLSVESPRGAANDPSGGGPDALNDSFKFFTGGRALAENLQLDRGLNTVAAGGSTVPVKTIAGITVGPIDWTTLSGDIRPALDPLAALIPADQHAVFFASFGDLVAVGDELERQGAPLVRFSEMRSENERALERYERQLGLTLSAASRLLGPALVKSVAITGSDPYFFTGTDVAVLFEARDAGLLRNVLAVRIAAAAQDVADARRDEGATAGVEYTAWRSPDRTMSSYLAALDSCVVVTNSLAQLGRLAGTARRESASLAALPEYAFFRERYRLGEDDESAFVFLSDATIRRWCGPRWRIAESRRTRALARMAQQQAERIDGISRDRADRDAAPEATAEYGTLAFLTPILELNLEHATRPEADAYSRWRDAYQRNWTWRFDPIGMRLSVRPERVAMDVTIMPLIANTEYFWLMDLSRGKALAADSGDPHDALAHVALAVNPKSALLQLAGAFKFDKWLGKSVSIYADDDPFWRELAKSSLHDFSGVLEQRSHELPIAIHFDVTNVAAAEVDLKHMLNLLGVIDHDTREKHLWRDLPYYKIPGRALFGGLGFYYRLGPAGLTISPNEDLLKRAIDREIAGTEAGGQGRSATDGSRPWLGSSLGLDMNPRAVEALNTMFGTDYQAGMQSLCWGNLPILNEWKRLFPDRDPVEVHEQFWHARPVCPGGGAYVWNDTWHTMESTVLGHPGEPKEVGPLSLPGWRHGRCGLTFEERGLRARVEGQREPPP